MCRGFREKLPCLPSPQHNLHHASQIIWQLDVGFLLSDNNEFQTHLFDLLSFGETPHNWWNSSAAKCGTVNIAHMQFLSSFLWPQWSTSWTHTLYAESVFPQQHVKNTLPYDALSACFSHLVAPCVKNDLFIKPHRFWLAVYVESCRKV